MLPKLRTIGTENTFKHLLQHKDIVRIVIRYKTIFYVYNICSAFDDRLDIKITCMNTVCFGLHNNMFSVHQ